MGLSDEYGQCGHGADDNGVDEGAYHGTDAFADGNIYSTTTDLISWVKGLVEAQFISQKSRDKMFKEYKDNYGYGWNIRQDQDGNTYYDHAGEWLGYQGYLRYDPAFKKTTACLSNEVDRGQF